MKRKFLILQKLSLIVITAFFALQKQIIAEEQKIKIVAEEVNMHSFFEIIKIDPKAPPKKEDPKQPPLDPNAPPKIVGSDVEIVTKILTKLNIPYEIQIVKWNQIVPMIEEGSADIVLGIQKNVKMQKHAYFPRTPLRSRNYVFYRLISEIDDQETLTYEEAVGKNLNVGIVVGFTYPKEFWDFYPYQNLQLNNHLFEGQDYKDNIIKLRTKKIDLFIADRERVSVLLKKLGADETVFQYRNILYWRDYYCVFPKKAHYPKKELIQAQFERELYKMTESDVIPEINLMWIQKGY